MSLSQKETYARMVCLFLAEGLRTRKIKLARAADIADKVLQNINLLDSERDFLNLVKEMAKDFDELGHLEQKIYTEQTLKNRRDMEQRVREFATTIIATDPRQALEILKDGASETATLDVIKAKYPSFKEYLNAN